MYKEPMKKNAKGTIPTETESAKAKWTVDVPVDLIIQTIVESLCVQMEHLEQRRSPNVTIAATCKSKSVTQVCYLQICPSQHLKTSIPINLQPWPLGLTSYAPSYYLGHPPL